MNTVNKELLYIKKIFNYGIKYLKYLCNRLRYKEIHMGGVIDSPICITPSCISFKGEAYVYKQSRIQGVFQYNDKHFSPEIIIHNGVSIQQGLHLTCAKRIEIGDNTAIAAYVTITDINHPYEDISLPVERQDIQVAPVKIGKDCKIYNNAVILPGVTIGNHVVIGANSVVCHDVPDFCVIVGAPAKVIKKFDFTKKQWIRI